MSLKAVLVNAPFVLTVNIFQTFCNSIRWKTQVSGKHFLWSITNKSNRVKKSKVEAKKVYQNVYQNGNLFLFTTSPSLSLSRPHYRLALMLFTDY